MDRQAMYRDIARRTDGDIYIGVVGPVRTGKSTFIKRFMELMVLPGVESEAERARLTDELPVSGNGKTIMTTQPLFLPGESANVALGDQAQARFRLVDCVGYLIKGAMGLREDEKARLVRTPWFDHDIPFEQAAEYGTRKVISDHATLGMLVTTDGTVTDFPRSAYVEAEERVARELKELGKPFVIVLNSAEPDSEAAARLRDALAEKYAAPVALVDARDMTEEQAGAMLESLLFEFPLAEATLRLPAWVGALPDEHWLVRSLVETAEAAAPEMRRVRDHARIAAAFAENPNARGALNKGLRLAQGAVDYEIDLADGLFYRVLGEESGQEVRGEEHLLKLLTEMTQAKRAYDRVADALKAAEETGYGLVAPSMAELALERPEIFKQGGRFGVKLKASAPSLHMIKVNVGAEVSPVVGTEEQSEELVKYLLSEFEADPSGIWNTNLFGKSLSDMMREGLSGKLNRMPGEVQEKLREAVTKIINEGSGGMICILL